VVPSYDPSDDAGRRNKAGELTFDGFPDFRPRLTPRQVIAAGSFGGCYFHPRGGKPGIKSREIKVSPEDHPREWFEGVPESYYKSRR